MPNASIVWTRSQAGAEIAALKFDDEALLAFRHFILSVLYLLSKLALACFYCDTFTTPFFKS
mgnify:CR=1 FL=1